MGECNPSKRRAKYTFRERKNPQFSDAKYDAQLDEVLKLNESEYSSSDESSPQNIQFAPVAPMMSNVNFGNSEYQPAKGVAPADITQNEPAIMPKGKPSPRSSQMPAPPRISKKTLSPQSKPPKSQKIVLKTKKKSLASSGTSAGAHTTTVSTKGYLAPTVEDDIDESTIPKSTPFQEGAKLGYPPVDLPQNHASGGAVDASRHATQFDSQSKPRDSPLQQMTPVSLLSADEEASSKSPQKSIPTQAGTENKLPVTKHATAIGATTYATSELKPKLAVSSSDNLPQPRPKAQMKFFIVIREPRDTMMVWPEGKIQGTSLSEFIAGVEKAAQRDCVESFDLTLKTSTSDTKVPIVKNDEDSWLDAKKLFTERLKAARMESKLKGLNYSVNPEIHVEPFFSQAGNVEDGEEEEDEQISFF
jgi:hypothetical protein